MAVVVAIVALVVTGYRSTPFQGPLLLLVVPLGVTTNLVPLVLRISHVLRTWTVARRTAAITCFSPHLTDRPGIDVTLSGPDR